MSGKIGITGATGQLGRLVVNKLKMQASAAEIVALVRSPGNAASLGVIAREADYSKPKTLDQALTDIDTLLLISGNEAGRRVAQHRNVIEAAKKANVKRLVYISGLHADSLPRGMGEEHRLTEDTLKTSGISFTVLRNGLYTENFIPRIQAALSTGVLVGSAGDGKFSTATRDDLAAAAVAVLTSDGHEGKTYELGGDEAFTLSDLVTEVTRQTGKTILYKNLPEVDFAATLTGAGLPEGLARMRAAMDAIAAQAAFFDADHRLSALIGRSTTPLSVVISNAIK